MVLTQLPTQAGSKLYAALVGLLTVCPTQASHLSLSVAKITWLGISVLQGFAAPASDAPVKIVNVYGQRYKSPAFSGSVLAVG